MSNQKYESINKNYNDRVVQSNLKYQSTIMLPHQQNYKFYHLLPKIDVKISEYIRSIAEDKAFVGLFLKKYFINYVKMIVRYGNNIDTMFRVYKNEEILIRRTEPRTI